MTPLHFSVSAYAAWAPGVETAEAWLAWLKGNVKIQGEHEPSLKAMPSALRRRTNMPGKMALEVAYHCDAEAIPTIFCSRHGECHRSIALLNELTNSIPLSPTNFSLSVHNAPAGLYAMARGDTSNNLALAAGDSTIEHAIIEACGLLADGASAVLVVAYDCPPPALFNTFQASTEQAYAWAWRITAPTHQSISLTLTPNTSMHETTETAGLAIWRFFLNNTLALDRYSNGQHWHWRHHA